MPRSILKSTSSSSTSSDRRVSFNKRVQAVHVKHHRDYSRKELESYWYTPADYEAIKEEAKRTIEYYDDSASSTQDCLEEPNFCLRGLEHRTESEKGTRYHLRKAAWYAVLDEQEAQEDMGMPDNSAMLCEAYRLYSIPSLTLARQRGWKDAEEAGYAAEAEPSTAAISKSSEKAECCLPATAMRVTRAQQNSIVSQAA